jgi:prepilin-type N-terminal cleavage/methylation domain-containing protein
VRRAGFSLVELIVAMTILSLGVLVLAAAGSYAQRSFAAAESVERAATAAALVLDSLMHVAVPADGARVHDEVRVSWTTRTAGGLLVVRADVKFADGGRSHRIVFHASRAEAP